MSSPFTITPTPPTSAKVDVGKDAKFSFTVTDLSAPDHVRDVLLQALLIGPDDKGTEVDWLIVAPATMTMKGGKTETIAITARPQASGPRGEQSIALVVADRLRPNDVFARSAPVTCEVIDRPGDQPPPRRFPLWLIAAIVGGVVVLGGVGLAIWKLSARSCEEGAVMTCVAGSCPGTRRCTDEAWTPCAANDEQCPLRPANDNFAFATPLVGLPATIAGTTRLATRETGEPDHYTASQPDAGAWQGDHTVWYRWKAPASAPAAVTIDVCTAAIDSILAVYTGTQLAALTRIIDNNNDCSEGWGSKVTFAPTGGTTYLFAVGDAGGGRESTFTLRVR